MSIPDSSVRSPGPSSSLEVTVDGMVSFMNHVQKANPEDNSGSSPQRLRRSRQRSAAVLMTTMFNAMGPRNADEGGDRPKATLYADMSPCFDDILVEYSLVSDVGTLTLVLFGLPGKDPCNRFTLTHISPTKWEYDGLIHLPKTMPELTMVLESELLGDIGCVYFAGDELSTANSSGDEAGGSAIERPFSRNDSAQGSAIPTLTLSVTSVMTERTQYIPIRQTPIPKPQMYNEPLMLTSRGRDLKSQFDMTDKRDYLDEAVETFSKALALVQSTDAGTDNSNDSAKQSVRAFIQLEHGQALSERFARFGDIADVAQAIGSFEEALVLASSARGTSMSPSLPRGFPTTVSLLATAQRYLGIAFIRRYDTLGDVEDLERAVALEREECENGHIGGRPFALGRLGTYLMRRFVRFGSLPDIDEAVECQRRALEGPTAAGSPTNDPILLAQRQSDLGTVLLQRFKATGHLSDVHEAVIYFKKAAKLVTESASGPPAVRGLEVFNGLAMALMRRFEHLGDLNDINEAISAEQQALHDIPLDSPDRHTILNNLALCFQRHYQHTKDTVSLHETIEALRQAIDVTPQGHLMLPATLNNYATALAELYESTRQVNHIKQAVAAQVQAIDRTPVGHPSLATFYDNLGHFHRTLFSATSDPKVIQYTIDAHRKALTLASPTHPEYSLILANLGTSLVSVYGATVDPGDLQESIAVLERSLSLTPAGHSHIADRQWPLARAYYGLYLANHDVSDMEKAFSLYSLAASSAASPAKTRITIAEEWVRRAQHAKAESETFDAMEVLMQLIAFVAGMEQSLERRYENLSELSMLVLESAVFAATQLQEPGKALEWLEQGRGLVWRQLSSLRTPLEDLRDVNPALASQLETLSAQLEQSSAVSSRRANAGIVFNGSELQARRTIHDQGAHQAKISMEREKVIQTIRSTIPGFENFLQTPSAHEILQYLPNDGPVVILGTHPNGCYALALLAGTDEPLYIPLALTWARTQQLGSLLETNLSRYGVRSRGESVMDLETADTDIVNSDPKSEDELARGIRKYTHRSPAAEHGIGFVLRELWFGVVKPVVEALALSKISSDRRPTRIWWCPTGPLTSLPIHAAGVYGGSDAACLADYVVSSYTPTVAVLAERVKGARAHPSQGARLPASGLLIISQPDTPGCTPIPGTTLEADHISRELELFGVPSQRLDGDEATVGVGLKGMEDFNCIHLACHATQRQDRPLHSGFYLHDGRLELSTIMRSNLKKADLAFLSACQTSTGSAVVPEEAVHLAAGMLSAGYRGVVATMWSIQDEYAPQLAGDFYQYLLKNSHARANGQLEACIDGAMAAYALHHATRKLRERLGDSDISFLTWVPYVHFGL